MPAKGKHRRPKANPFSRGFIAAGTGGAAIALPLIGATGAHAAQQGAPAATPKAAPATTHTAASLPAQQSSAAASASAAKATATTKATKVYSVVSGDYLSKIAAEQRVRGGWQQLYEDNRQAIGGNPELIHPGLKLSIGTRASTAPSSAPSAAPSARSEAPSKSSGTGSTASKSSGTGATASKSSGTGSSAAKSSRTGASAGASAGTSASNTTTQTTGAGFTKPVDASIGTSYRAAGGSWSSGYHTGVDFIASSGSTVKAIGAGTVVSAGWGGSYGNQVVIRHSDGKYSQYAHLSALSVSVGQSLSAGQQIGLSGATGNVTGPHLHFEVRTGPDYGSDIDPIAYLRSRGVTV
ncbi:M23 family metallopeptidase [Streptomyces corynorhini]|uniref:LysM peptidoglycan-binding domain-containing protein n=1 Tax=Streptomyces corynorhini TaxID=2282652 RepID=A0A370B4X8_9ACTN|nr:LysM peptidoglycan-binding domain-containing M23 family metallopeptidase [Streptomyces corynorhini]RDG36897.1 LysM peptidoglycan-binding domain-containing protein [Streptomyces corynorhini]